MHCSVTELLGLAGPFAAFGGWAVRVLPPAAFWVDNLSPFLVRFHGDIGIRYYGLAYLLGFVAAYILFQIYWRAGRSRLPADRIQDFMAAIVFGVILGGRLGYFLLYEPGKALSDPLVVFRIWDGGMASHGGMIGVAIAAFWFARSQGIRLAHLSDLVVSAAPAGLFFGRVANFINGELWGKVTDVPWAVIFPRSEDPGTPLHLILPRHPSQLYEALLEGAVLFAYMQHRFWRSDVVRDRPGRLTGEFLIGYALARAAGEMFREPDASLILGLSRGTFYSLFLVAAGAALCAAPKKPLDPVR
jgi:phosphatidylglycerol:prolipoprotein diacylglycerol transferase